MTKTPPPPSEPAEPFWRTKKLAEMSAVEWESLCDGCARCCLNKLEYEDTGEIAWTDVACRLLDGDSCRCRDYRAPPERVADCVALTPENVPELDWLPPTCGYRLVAEGRDLYWWHPLVSGDPETVHAGRHLGARAGRSARPAFRSTPSRITSSPGRARARLRPKADFDAAGRTNNGGGVGPRFLLRNLPAMLARVVGSSHADA